MTKEELVEALESGSDEVYETLPGGLIQLNERGAQLCEEHGVDVDVDCYGCAYAPEHLIA